MLLIRVLVTRYLLNNYEDRICALGNYYKLFLLSTVNRHLSTKRTSKLTHSFRILDPFIFHIRQHTLAHFL
jgi:hypothetical protein